MLLIHPSKDSSHYQRLLITKLGIQQGRLLAWGDIVGILRSDAYRDPRLQDPAANGAIEKALQSIIDRTMHTDRATQLEKYGLKPSKRFLASSQAALNFARLESFRERLEVLQEQRWEVRRGMSMKFSHWVIADGEKFELHLNLIREEVDSLIGFFGIGEHVDRALKHDIRALGWHPVFHTRKAAADMSKLRMIQEACRTDYPSYLDATKVALDYLNMEWRDNYQENMERGRRTKVSEIPVVSATSIAKSTHLVNANKSTLLKWRGLLSGIRLKSWRR